MTDAEIGRFRRIEGIFDRALDRPPGPLRDAWLREACADDIDLYRDVSAFLTQHEALIALAPPPAEPMPRFGAWQAVKLLGRGGMGTVYLSDRADGAFEMQAAVKVVALALASPAIEQRFRRERQFLATLDHPRIARLFDGGVSEHGVPYMVMEYVDGSSIDRYCSDCALDGPQCVALLRQLLQALIYIHDRQVVHRDMKPSNILVDRDGQLKLLDFGTARLAEVGTGEEITQAGVFALTPEYASPEQLAGEKVTYASDIYAAGLVLRKILPPGSADRDPQLGLILDKALQPRSEDRYQSAVEMDLDLERCLAGLPVRATVPRKRVWLRWSLIGLAACAGICLALVWKFYPMSEPQSVAVLPFANLSSDPANQYFVDGLAGEITDELSHVRNLRVVAQSSTSRFKGGSTDISDAGHKLHVGSVLDGSVQREGDKIRIVARLSRVSDRSQLWSRMWDRNSSDLFNVQAELAADIAQSLKGALSAGSVPRHTPTPEAHELYMRARYLSEQLSTDSNAHAIEGYRRAIQADPAFAAAYVGLATALFNKGMANADYRNIIAARPEVERLFRKAIELDPGFSGAHGGLGSLMLQFDWDWKGAEREFQTASAVSPNAHAEIWEGMLLSYQRRFAEAEPHVILAQELDPLGTALAFDTGLVRLQEGRISEAREHFKAVALQNPTAVTPQLIIDITDVFAGQPQQGLSRLQDLKKRFPPAAMGEAMARARMGQREEALRLAKPFEDSYEKSSVPMYWYAMVYGFLNDAPNAVKWLQRSADRREEMVLNIGINLPFARMQNDPAFRELKKRIGLLQ